MATCTCGGEIGGYCAIGKENTASPPASVMTTDSTVAKIGRSMKKCEIMSGTPRGRQGDKEKEAISHLLVSLAPCLLVCSTAGRRSAWSSAPSGPACWAG